jgi:glutamate-1-semialdehyde 2,1-aminomutase
MFTLFFSPKPPVNFSEAARQDTGAFARFFRKMTAAGLYLPPSAFEAYFLSASHSENQMDEALEAFASC